MSAATTSRRCSDRQPATAASSPRRSVAVTDPVGLDAAPRAASPARAAPRPATAAGATTPVSRARSTWRTSSAMSRPFQSDQAPGRSRRRRRGRARAAGRASRRRRPRSATVRDRRGSLRSRRVAVSGSSRCSRTTFSTGRRRRPAGRAGRRCRRRSARRRCCGRRAGPCRRRAAAPQRTAGRGGRRRGRRFAACRAVSTRCRSTVNRCTGLCCGRLRTRAHSGSQLTTRPYRSQASQIEISAGPLPSSVSSASRAGAGHGLRHRRGEAAEPFEGGAARSAARRGRPRRRPAAAASGPGAGHRGPGEHHLAVLLDHVAGERRRWARPRTAGRNQRSTARQASSLA